MDDTQGRNDRVTTRGVLILQGAYFVLTGIWPVLHLRSFYAVTGPKVDGWLVKTFGALVAVVGAVLLSAVARGRVSGETKGLAIGSAGALALSDTYFATRGRISKRYLADAAVELMFIAGLMTPMRPRRTRQRKGYPAASAPHADTAVDATGPQRHDGNGPASLHAGGDGMREGFEGSSGSEQPELR